MPLRSAGVPGLIFTPGLTSRQVSSLQMTFEPSLGIMARRVDKLGLDIRSFREPLKRSLVQVIIPSILMNFHKHGRPRWQPLSEYTIAQKGSPVPLVRSGMLKRVMGQQNIWHLDSEKLLLANLPESVWYGVIHQAGIGDQAAEADMWFDPVAQAWVNVGESSYESDTRNIPARPFVLIQPDEWEKIDEIFLDWLDERARAADLPTSARAKILTGDL